MGPHLWLYVTVLVWICLDMFGYVWICLDMFGCCQGSKTFFGLSFANSIQILRAHLQSFTYSLYSCEDIINTQAYVSMFSVLFCHPCLPSWSLAGSARDDNQAHLGAERQETVGIPEGTTSIGQSRAAFHLRNKSPLLGGKDGKSVLVSDLYWYLIWSTANK